MNKNPPKSLLKTERLDTLVQGQETLLAFRPPPSPRSPLHSPLLRSQILPLDPAGPSGARPQAGGEQVGDGE